ncbi:MULTISPECIES: hypothetical protein [unclassified Brevundimonas]|uniref:hypothetical protein n=1 Tax=unclassified Brevundimonas TaxID=2622653 RepID=UPI003F9261B8
MSVCIVPDRTIGLVAGFVTNQPNILPSGWSVRTLSQRLRALNELTFRERYPQAAIDREWSECPEPVLSASLPQIFRALQDVVYSSNLAADREAALIVSSILGRAIELLPEGADKSGNHEPEVFSV